MKMPVPSEQDQSIRRWEGAQEEPGSQFRGRKMDSHCRGLSKECHAGLTCFQDDLDYCPVGQQYSDEICEEVVRWFFYNVT